MAKQWTHEMYVQKVFELVGNEFEVRGQYFRNGDKVLMYHEECGREFYIRPADFKRRKRCSLCHGNFRKTTAQFKAEVKKLSNDEYAVLGGYKNDATHIVMKHKACGYVWKATPTHFIQGKRCPQCAGNIKKEYAHFLNEVFELEDDDYSVLSIYEKAHRKVKFKHNSYECNGNEFYMTPTDFLGGKRCPDCARLNRSGEKHWKYNPYLTPEERAKRDMQNGEIKKWRNKVYERDSYTCQVCSQHAGSLNAHHINSWDTFEEQRFIISNGVTLCNDCHKSFHTRYGYGKNTIKQYKEFVASL